MPSLPVAKCYTKLTPHNYVTPVQSQEARCQDSVTGVDTLFSFIRFISGTWPIEHEDTQKLPTTFQLLEASGTIENITAISIAIYDGDVQAFDIYKSLFTN